METGAYQDRHQDICEATEKREMLSDHEENSKNMKTLSGRNHGLTCENINPLMQAATSSVISAGGCMRKEAKDHEGLSADHSVEAENDKRGMCMSDNNDDEKTASDDAGGGVYPICLYRNVHVAGQQNVPAVGTHDVQSAAGSSRLNPLVHAAISSANSTDRYMRKGVSQIHSAANFTKCVGDRSSGGSAFPKLEKRVPSTPPGASTPCDTSTPPPIVVDVAMGTVQKPYYCLVCHQAFTTSGELVTHAKTHSVEQGYQCPNCMSSFARKADLKKHSKLCMDGSDPELSISFEKTFSQKKKKKKKTTREKSKSSDGSVSSPDKVDSDMTTRAKTQPKKVSCSECPLAFPNMARLRKHIRTHTGEKPFACSLCPSAFSRSSDLTRHHRTHSGDRPYQCTLCPAAFPTSCKLTMHTRTHTGEKPYRCAHCPRAFARKTDLNMHERTHTGVKPHLCSQCAMSFTTASKLKVHSRVHSGEKPYQCPLCFARFTQTAGLRKHSKLHIRSSLESDTS